MTKIYRVQMNKHGAPNFATAEEVADRPKGKWHHIQSVCYGGGTMNEVVCSKCHEHQILPTNFCPYCGADMRGEDNETD